MDMLFELNTRVGPRNHVLLFLVSIFTHPRNAGVFYCVKILRIGVNILRGKVSVEVYRPTTPSVKELFFTLGVVDSFTLGVVDLSVDLSQIGRLCHSDCEPYLLTPSAASKLTWTPTRT